MPIRSSALSVWSKIPIQEWRTYPEPNYSSPRVKKVTGALAIILALAPITTIYFVLADHATISSSGMKAMYSLHLMAMIGPPLLYLCLWSRDWSYYQSYTRTQINVHWPDQIALAIFCGFVGFIYGVCGWQLITTALVYGNESESRMIERLVQDLDPDSLTLRISAMWFAFANPVIEELYWRVFLYKELGHSLFPAVPPKPAEDVYVDLCETSIRGPTAVDDFLLMNIDGKLVASYDVKITRFGQMCLALAYASYHVLVLWRFTHNGITTTLGGLDLFIYGMIFIRLRADSRFGWLCATALHAGLDLSLIFNMALNLHR